MFRTRHAISSRQPEYAKLQRQLKGMNDSVRSIAVSPDSLNIAAASIKGKVRMWGEKDEIGFMLKEPPAYSNLVMTDITFSLDGQFLAAGIDKTVYLWIVKTGQPKFEFADRLGPIRTAVFSPDCKYFACGGKDIRIWNVYTKQQVHVLKGHAKTVSGLSYFSGATCLVSTSWDSTVRIWNLQQEMKLQNTWKGSRGRDVKCCALSPQGRLLASRGDDKQVIICDFETGNWLLRPYEGHKSSIQSVAFSPDEKHVASGSSGGVHIQDSESGLYITRVDGSAYIVVYTPDSKRIITRDNVDWKLIRVMNLTTPAVPLPISRSPRPVDVHSVPLFIPQSPESPGTQVSAVPLRVSQVLTSSKRSQSIPSPARDAHSLSELGALGLDDRSVPPPFPQAPTSSKRSQSILSPARDAHPLSELGALGLDDSSMPLPFPQTSGLEKGPQLISPPTRDAHPLSDVDVPMHDNKLALPSMTVKGKTKKLFAFWK